MNQYRGDVCISPDRSDSFSFRTTPKNRKTNEAVSYKWPKSKNSKYPQGLAYISSSWRSLYIRYIHSHIFNIIKIAYTRNLTPSQSVCRKVICEAAQSPDPRLPALNKSCWMVNVLPLSQCPLQFLCWMAVLTGSWCSSYFTNQSLNLHRRISIGAIKAARFQSWAAEEVWVLLINIFLLIKAGTWFNCWFQPDSETENQCSDGIIFAGQQNLPIASLLTLFLSLLLPPLLFLYSSVFYRLIFKSGFSRYLLSAKSGLAKSGLEVAKAKATRSPGFYCSGLGYSIPIDHFCLNALLKSSYWDWHLLRFKDLHRLKKIAKINTLLQG